MLSVSIPRDAPLQRGCHAADCSLCNDFHDCSQDRVKGKAQHDRLQLSPPGWPDIMRDTFPFPLYFRRISRIAIITDHPRSQERSHVAATLAEKSYQRLTDRWRESAGWIDGEMRQRIEGISPDCPDRLRDAIAYSLLAPGKRLRPVLCLLTCETVGGNARTALPGAMALEMIHCYSLIHDDLPAMDDDDLRRGRPTCHVQFDEATAILAGDALQPLAFETLLCSTLPAEVIRESCWILAKAAGGEGMVGGQMDDLLAEQRDSNAMLHEEQAAWLRSIHRRKTGALLEASVLMGAVAGEASSEAKKALGAFGRAIGIAFQIVDDLLDVESTAENTGKATGKDSARGKLTYPSIHGIEESRAHARQWVDQAVSSLDGFGDKSRTLRELAHYILQRSN